MKSKMWMALALLVLASLACSLGKAAETALEAGEDVATQAAETVPEVGEEVATAAAEALSEAEEGAGAAEEEEPAAEEVPPPEVADDALSGLDSYRMRVVAQWTPEGGTPEGLVMEQEHTRDPGAQRLVMEAGEGESVEWVQIGDKAWYCFGGTCSLSQGSEEEILSGFGEGMAFEPADLTAGSDYRYMGRETVNGVSTRHYVLDLTAAEAALMAQGDVSDVEGESWIADEVGLPEFVVRSAITWREKRGEQTGTTEWSYEIYDVNTQIAIEPPEGAVTALPEDVPMYPDATGLVSMEGMATFSAPDDVATVADFYRAELAAQGWTNESDDELGGMINQVWHKDGRNMTLMVSPEEEEGGSSVVITVE